MALYQLSLSTSSASQTPLQSAADALHNMLYNKQ